MPDWMRGRQAWNAAEPGSPARGGNGGSDAGSGPAGAPSDSVSAEVTALIHATAERWNSQDYASVLELWDGDEPVPFYLAEEQRGWFIGWQALRAYLDPPRPSPAVQGIREEMHDIHVKEVAPGIAVAAWEMHFEMKIIGRPPIGENVRVSAVLRRTAAGWRYIHWAESPMTASIYLQSLMEKEVDREKFQAVHERAMQKHGKAR